MLVQTATGQRPGSTLYHVGDGFYFRVNRQHLKTVYVRCASPGCKVTGSMASNSSLRTHIKTAGRHNHPPDMYKYEILAFSERLYQRCRVETTPLKKIFQEELSYAPIGIRPMLVMAHYLKRMQNLRKRLRAQSLRAKINLTTQDDSVLLYEDGTPIKDSGDEMSSGNKISLKDVHYLPIAPDNKKEENNDLKSIDNLVMEIQSTNVPITDLQEGSDDSKQMEDQTVQTQKKKITTHGFQWTEKRIDLLFQALRHYYAVVVRHKDNPKQIWEVIAKEVDPDVKWYTVKKKWTQLEDGYRTYVKDLKETGDQGLYRPAYLDEVRKVINANHHLNEFHTSIIDQSITTETAFGDHVYLNINDDDDGGGGDELVDDVVECSDVDKGATELNSPVHNSDHLYTTMDSIKQDLTNRITNNDTSRNDTSEGLTIETLLRIHKEQLEESRRRMDSIMTALEESRTESREVTQCIKKLTDAVIQRLSAPGRIIVAQKRNHT